MKNRLKTKFLLGGALVVVLAVVVGSLLHDDLMARGVGAPWDFLLTLGPFLLILLLPFWLALQRWVFRPLERLGQANRQAAEGDVEAAVIPDAAIPGDEIGALMRSRNEMLDALLHHQRRLEEEKKHAQALNRALLSFAADETESGLNLILEHTCRHLGLEGGWVLLRGDEGEPYRLAAFHNLPQSVHGREAEFFASASHCNECIAVLAQSLQTRRPALRVCHRFVSIGEERHVLVTPLAVGGHLQGMMDFLAPEDFQLSEPLRTFLENAASAVSLALSRAQLHEQLKARHVEEQETLLRLSRALLGEMDTQSTLDQATRVAAQTLDVDYAAIALIDEQGQSYSGKTGLGWPPEMLRQTQRIPLAEDTGLGYAIRTRAPVVVPDESLETRFETPPWVAQMGVAATLIVPLLTAGEAIGGLVVNSRPQRDWSDDDVRLLSLIANQAAQALQGARLHERAQRHLAELEARQRVTQDILETLDLEKRLITMLAEAMALLGAEVGAIYLLEDHHLRLAIQTGMGDELLATLDELPVGDEPPWQTVPDAWQRSGELSGLQTRLSLPLRARKTDVGAIILASPRAAAFEADHVRALSGLAEQTAVGIENAQLYAAEQTRRQELDALYGLSRQLVATDEMDTVLDNVARHAVETVHVTFSRILTLEEDGAFLCRAAYPAHLLDCDMGVGRPEPAPAWPHHQRALSHGEPLALSQTEPALSAEERQALFLLNPSAGSDVVPEGVAPEFNSGTSTSSQGPALTQSLCLAPMHVGDEAVGVLMLGETRSETREPFDADKLRLTAAIADQAASALHRAQLHAQLEEGYIETVLALAKAMDARDSYTGDHSQRLAVWAEATARELGCSAAEVRTIYWGALLHDIGKIGVADEVLRKPGALTEDEWAIMKRHPEIGADIVAPVKKLAQVAPIIRAHQEKYDGSGYPDGLQGEKIPLGARVLTVVDAYSAITDERVYRKARSHAEAIVELRRCAGAHFDPTVVEAFLSVISEQ